jgi:hypothetical protein
MSRALKWAPPVEVLFAGGLAVLGFVRARARRRTRVKPPENDLPTHWADRIQALAAPVEELVGWPNLGSYLKAVAYTESSGNPRADTNKGSNSARGWFGLRPKTARITDVGLDVEALKQEVESVALAAWLAYRLWVYGGKNPRTWLELRRGWRLPSLLEDDDEQEEGSVDVRRRFEEALDAVGLDHDFMYEEAIPADFHWPGFKNVLAAVRAVGARSRRGMARTGGNR